MRTAARIAIPVIAPRAIVIWGLTRLIVAALLAISGEHFGATSPSPIAVILLAGLLGLLDVRIRGERILWANLGVRPMMLYAAYSATAIPAELLLALALR